MRELDEIQQVGHDTVQETLAYAYSKVFRAYEKSRHEHVVTVVMRDGIKLRVFSEDESWRDAFGRYKFEVDLKGKRAER